jgi:hypothetical protein
MWRFYPLTRLKSSVLSVENNYGKVQNRSKGDPKKIRNQKVGSNFGNLIKIFNGHKNGNPKQKDRD